MGLFTLKRKVARAGSAVSKDEVRQIVREEIQACIDTISALDTPDSWSCMTLQFDRKFLWDYFIEKVMSKTKIHLRGEMAKWKKEYLDTELFIDTVVQRIRDKQL